jgi:hypothetical protein
MTISDDQLSNWLDLLEEILQAADLHKEYLFGIHIDAAIEALHRSRGTTRTLPGTDQ